MVADGEVSRKHVVLSSTRRKEHLALLGKTGTGKSSLMRWLCAQDIAAGRGFIYFDLHGDTTPFLVRRVALEEKKKHCDLSNRLIVIDPADTERSVGMNILEQKQGDSAFVQIAELEWTGATVRDTLITTAVPTGLAAWGGKYGTWFGRGGKAFFNRGPVRLGWYWAVTRDAIGLRIGEAGSLIHWHIPFWYP